MVKNKQHEQLQKQQEDSLPVCPHLIKWKLHLFMHESYKADSSHVAHMEIETVQHANTCIYKCTHSHTDTRTHGR